MAAGDRGVRWGADFDAPIDHGVKVMRLDDVDRKPIAIPVSITSHPSMPAGASVLSG